MSEPLEFSEEAELLRSCIGCSRKYAPRIEQTLREAAAKALEWAISIPLKYENVQGMIASLRTPSAPNAPKEAE